MKNVLKHALLGLALAPIAFAPLALADDHDGHDSEAATGLVKAVRQATRLYRDVIMAEAEGWASLGRCVSGAGDEGAMGIHYVNFPLVVDENQLDPTRPEVLMYEVRGGRKRLLGGEFIVFAAEWDAAHPDGTPPSLMGQLFHYVAAPNRYRLPSVYILHVWAWRKNPNGSFSNWNPRVSCDEYTGTDPGMAH